MADDKPKIQIDTDWKAQAQAEKERLGREAEEKAKKQPPAGTPGVAGAAPEARGGKGRPGEPMPPPDFHALVSSIISQALLYMGAIPDPQTGQGIIHMDLARYNIDLLGVLEEKTKGNLTDEESKLLTQAVHELRLSYLQLSKQVTEHLRKQAEAGAKLGGKGPGIVQG